MTDNVSRFLEASRSDADLARKVNAIGSEAAALVAARLSELSQGTAYPFGAEEALAQSPLSDGHLEAVSGGAGRYAMSEFSIGPFTFHFPSLNPLRHI